MSNRGIRVGAALMLALGLGFSLGGCSGQGSATEASDAQSQGFVSGDGSVQTWIPDRRGDPVTLTGKDFEGNAVDTSTWLGDVVVLNTWYAGCAPCRAEAPDLVAIANEDGPKGVHFLGINTTDEQGTATAFQRTFKVPYPSIEDSSGAAVATLSGTVPLQAVPSTVVLDRQGRVAARVIGRTDRATLTGLIGDVLAERSPSSSHPGTRPPTSTAPAATTASTASATR